MILTIATELDEFTAQLSATTVRLNLNSMNELSAAEHGTSSSPRNGFAVIARGARRTAASLEGSKQAQAAILRDVAQGRGSSG
jgi:hypothetical protein